MCKSCAIDCHRYHNLKELSTLKIENAKSKIANEDCYCSHRNPAIALLPKVLERKRKTKECTASVSDSTDPGTTTIIDVPEDDQA